MKTVLFVLLYFALSCVQGMDRNMDILGDENCDKSPSDSKRPSRHSGEEKRSSERSHRVESPLPSMVTNFTECLELGTRLWISSKNKSIKRLGGNPYPTSPRRSNPVLRMGGRRSGNTMAGDSQAGMSLVGFSNVAGICGSTPFLQEVSKSVSESSDPYRSQLPEFTLPTTSPEPNLFLQQELSKVEPSSDPKDLPQLPQLCDPSFGAMFEQFQKLDMSTDKDSKLGSMQPLHLACANSIEGQACPIASASQSLPQMGPSYQARGLSVTSDNDFKSIVKTALNLMGFILKVLTNRINLPIAVVNITNSLVPLLENVAYAFTTIERHPDSVRVFDASLFTRIIVRISEVTARVQQAIYRHRAGQDFDLGDRLESLLVEDLKMWYSVLEQMLNEI